MRSLDLALKALLRLLCLGQSFLSSLIRPSNDSKHRLPHGPMYVCLGFPWCFVTGGRLIPWC